MSLGRPSPAEYAPPAWAAWSAGALAAVILVGMATLYDGRVSTPYFTPRALLLYPAVAAVFVVWLLAARPVSRGLRIDLLDVCAFAFVLWQVVATVFSPARLLALMGEQNRGIGALFWIAVVLLLLLLRRLLAAGEGRSGKGSSAERAGLRLVAAGAAVALVVAGLAALAQSQGVWVPWKEVDLSTGRMTGSTGNAVSLGGLSLLALWAGVIASGDRLWGWPLRVLSALGVAAGAAALVLAVSRAAYLGLAVGAVVLAAFLVRGHSWRRLAGLAAVVALVIAATLLHGTSELTSVGSGDSNTTAVEPDRAVSDEIRVDLWRAALRATVDRPVTGFGPGAFTAAYFRSIDPGFLVDDPEAVATDPHDVVLLLTSTSGVPGALLGLGAMVLALIATVRGRGRAIDAGRSLRADVCLAGVCYAGGAAAFLLVSPSDLVVVVPLAILLAVAAGPPEAGVLRARDLSPLRWGRPVEAGFALLGGAALVASLVVGVQFHRADTALAEGLRQPDPALAEEAARLFEYSPRFGLIAGSMVWRRAANDGDLAEAQRGEALLRAAVRRDPSRAMAWIELGRLYLALGRFQDAVAAVDRGLEVSPHHPLLEGLLGSTALAAFQKSGDGELVRSSTERLETYPPETPDGWYWLGAVYAARGDRTRANDVYENAKAIAPELSAEDYVARIRGGG